MKHKFCYLLFLLAGMFLFGTARAWAVSTYIALFYDPASLLSSPTMYINPSDAIRNLDRDSNSYGLFASTTGTATFLIYLTSPTAPIRERDVSKKEVYKVTEQVVAFDSMGRVKQVTSKFLAPFQWAVLLSDVENPDYGVMGSTDHPVNTRLEKYARSTDPIALAEFATLKTLNTGLQHKIYKGDLHSAKARYDFVFTLP